MPIWLRKFTFMKLKEYYEKSNDTDSTQHTERKKEHKIAKPDINPTYSAKASK